MRKFIGALLPAALLVTGCEDVCQKGIELRQEQITLQTVINGTIVQPTLLTNTCLQFRNTGRTKLNQGALLAERAATKFFYSSESRCLRGHYEQRCGFAARVPSESHDRGPTYMCDSIYICDEYEKIEHRRDGYQQAMKAAQHMRTAAVDFEAACNETEQLVALMQLTSAKIELEDAQTNTDYVLQKAGCFEPGRKGE